MKFASVLLIVLATAPAWADQDVAVVAKPKKPTLHEAGPKTPIWLEKDLKPIVKKPIVTK